jgi:hypothetical protein
MAAGMLIMAAGHEGNLWTMTHWSVGRGSDLSEVAQCGAGNGEGPLAFEW